MTLKEANCGDVVRIKGFKGENLLLKKVMAMGIRIDELFEVLKKCGRNILIQNENHRLILSKELADQIEVEILQQKPSLKEEISCDLLDSICPEEGKPLPSKNKPKGKWLFLHKICPFLKG